MKTCDECGLPIEECNANALRRLADRRGVRVSVTLHLEEGDRQLMLLALALCSRLRPGFDLALGLIAERLQGKEMFEEFKRFNENVPPQHSAIDVKPRKET